MRLTIIVLLLSGAAHADSSVGAPPKVDPKRCSHESAPFWGEWSSAPAKKLTPKGMSLKQAGGKKHFLYTTGHFDKPHKSVVVDRENGKLMYTLEGHENTALVEDPDGKLIGLLSLTERRPAHMHLQLHAPSGERWKAQPVVDVWGDSAATLVAGDLLVVAFFHRIATGSQLLAFDLLTGDKKWTADVQQLNVGHSKYWNDVAIERAGDTIVMRGFEAAGCYVQSFDLKTGKRLSSSVHKSW